MVVCESLQCLLSQPTSSCCTAGETPVRSGLRSRGRAVETSRSGAIEDQRNVWRSAELYSNLIWMWHEETDVQEYKYSVVFVLGLLGDRLATHNPVRAPAVKVTSLKSTGAFDAACGTRRGPRSRWKKVIRTGSCQCT